MAPEEPTVDGLQDDLVQKLIGEWRISREMRNQVFENTAKITWELNHRYLRIEMNDVVSPPRYAAHIYIGYERPNQRYVIHWMDVTAGSGSDLMGYGRKEGNALIMEWRDEDSLLVNTFTWDPTEDCWTSRIEQTGADGNWQTFCVDTYRRV